MILDALIKFLNEKNWKMSSANSNFQFYSPPSDLGFDSSYFLPVPSKEDALDFDKAILLASNVISEIYQKDFTQLITDVEDYLGVLKKDAIYFKLSSEQTMFGNTLEISDIWKFLKNINSSYTNYLHIDFIKSFKNRYNAEKLRSIANPVIEYSKLRLVDLEYKSFSIGISADSMMGNDKIPYKDVVEWRRQKMTSYKKEIINVNYNRRDEIDSLLEKYNEEERKKIFSPLIKSINTEGHRIYLTDQSFGITKELCKLPTSTVETILPKTEAGQEEPDIEMVQLITAIDRNKKSITIRTDELENDLFSKKTTEFNWQQDNILVDDKTIQFTQPIVYKVILDTNNGIFRASHEILPIDATSSTLKHMKSQIESQIVSLYERYLHIKYAPSWSNKEAQELVEYFNKITK